MKALVIISLQNDFGSFGNAAVESADSLADSANTLMPYFDRVVAVNFAFPPNHLSFAANHLFRQPGKSMVIKGQVQQLKVIHCVEGSFGAEFPLNLNSKEIDFIQKVGTDSETDIYSIFRDLDANDNGLMEFLKSSGISSLYFIGISGTFFQNSIKDATDRGFEVLIIPDATVGELDFIDSIQVTMEEIIKKSI